MNTYTIEGGGSFIAIRKHTFWGGSDVIFQSGTMPSVGCIVHNGGRKYIVTAILDNIISLSKAPLAVTPDNKPHKPWWFT